MGDPGCSARERSIGGPELIDTGQFQREVVLSCDGFYEIQLLEEFIVHLDNSQTFGNTDRGAATVDVGDPGLLRLSANGY